ncbi:piggyBac transposable element-derived protein 4 [Trichonephila clavipes]|nr:piggyBac transposable element-derived protein 4 [Trichonephila clavipes]
MFGTSLYRYRRALTSPTVVHCQFFELFSARWFTASKLTSLWNCSAAHELLFTRKENPPSRRPIIPRSNSFSATAHNPAIMTSVNRTRKDCTKEEVPCPPNCRCILRCHGRERSLRSKKRKIQIGRSVEWWHRIFYFLIDLAIINRSIMWQVNKSNRPVNIPHSISSSAYRRIFLKKKERTSC